MPFSPLCRKTFCFLTSAQMSCEDEDILAVSVLRVATVGLALGRGNAQAMIPRRRAEAHSHSRQSDEFDVIINPIFNLIAAELRICS